MERVDMNARLAARPVRGTDIRIPFLVVAFLLPVLISAAACGDDTQTIHVVNGFNEPVEIRDGEFFLGRAEPGERVSETLPIPFNAPLTFEATRVRTGERLGSRTVTLDELRATEWQLTLR
jgi:hypothetical protein